MKMKNKQSLKGYLQAIKECPDELVDLNQENSKRPRMVSRLTYEFGISNNWPINLRTDMSSMEYYFTKCQRYIPIDKKKLKGPEGSLFVFHAQNPIVGAHLTPWIYDQYLIGTKKEKAAMGEYYTTGIFLFTEGSTEGEGAVETCRRLADVVGDISRWILSQNIPALLPRTKGWKYNQELKGPKSMIEHKLRRPNTQLSSLILKAQPWLPTVEQLLSDTEPLKSSVLARCKTL